MEAVIWDRLLEVTAYGFPATLLSCSETIYLRCSMFSGPTLNVHALSQAFRTILLRLLVVGL